MNESDPNVEPTDPPRDLSDGAEIVDRSWKFPDPAKAQAT